MTPVWSHPFLTTSSHNAFHQLLIFRNLYQHARNHTFSSHCSTDIVDSKIIQSNWSRAFWPISQEPHFLPKMAFAQERNK